MIALRSVTLALAFIIGIVLRTTVGPDLPPVLLLVLSLAGFAGSAFLWWQERKWKEWPYALVVGLLILAGLPLGYLRTQNQLGPPPPNSLRAVLPEVANWSDVAFRGQVTSEPELRGSGRVEFRLTADEVRIGKPDDAEWQALEVPGDVLIRVALPRSTNDPNQAMRDEDRMIELVAPETYGFRIEVQSRQFPLEGAKNPGEFDMKRFLFQEGYLGQYRCEPGQVTILEETRGNPIVEFALVTKREFLEVYKRTIGEPASRLVAAATLGTRRAVEKVPFEGQDITESFRRAGVGHVLAVSGLHVSIISLLLYAIFRMTGLRPAYWVPIIVLMLGLFCILTGARPSSVRAAMMNSIALVAFAYFRCNLRQATYIGLAISGVAILLMNPLTLYAPSFLLSFGAVLSLVLIASTLDRWLCLLRGFSLVLGMVWLAGVVALANHGLEPFLQWPLLLGLLGMLWAFMNVGTMLNSSIPPAWRWGIDRLPQAIRFLLSAQFAIQFGMMIPLSAWFFGQFPVSGMIVNLVAIPAIGVLVQLGILTGLIGLIPVLGWLAVPLGATTAVVAQGFLWLANWGATAFNFPAMPRPTVGWLLCYYVGLGLVLTFEKFRPRVQTWVYHKWPELRDQRPLRLALAWGPAVVMMLAPLILLARPTPGLQKVYVLAAGQVPIVCLTNDRGRGVLVNGGDNWDGSGTVFSGMRDAGAASVDLAIAASPAPSGGAAGFAALSGKMRLRRALLPIVSETPEAYLEALGDDYVSTSKKLGPSYIENIATLYDAALANGIQVAPMTESVPVLWRDAAVEILPPPAEIPDKFRSSALTRPVRLETRGLSWMIVTDFHRDATMEVLGEDGRTVDVLVLPDIANRRGFQYAYNDLVKQLQPRLVILTGERPYRDFAPETWAEEHQGLQVLYTPTDGAILTEFRGGQAVFTGAISDRQVALGLPADQRPTVRRAAPEPAPDYEPAGQLDTPPAGQVDPGSEEPGSTQGPPTRQGPQGP